MKNIFFIPRILEKQFVILIILRSTIKKFLKMVFFGFFLCFFKILTPYLMFLGKYLIGCKCQKIEKNVNILKLT